MAAGAATKTAAGDLVPLLVDLLGRPSVEIAAGHPAAIGVLHDQFDPGSEVFVNFPPNGDYRAVVDTAERLRHSGFAPVPHIAARSIGGETELREFLARLAGDAGVNRVLLIAGDRPKPAGPFAASMDVLRTGAFAKAGIRAIGIAAHPEDHPLVATGILDAALAEKVDTIARAGHDIFIVTQFAFEAAPILARLRRIRQAGISAPVRIGIAGPASLATLVRFAVRCGVGNSLRTLRLRTNMVGRLLGDSRPEELLHDLGIGLAGWPESGVSGFHFFPFGGMEKTGAFIAETLSRLYGEIGRAAG